MKHSLPRFFSNDPSKTLFIRLPPCFSYTTFYTRNYRIIVVRAWCNISHRQLEHRLLIVLSREISDYRLHGRSNVTLASYTHVSRSVKIFHCARKSWFLVGRVNGKKKKKEEEGEWRKRVKDRLPLLRISNTVLRIATLGIFPSK